MEEIWQVLEIGPTDDKKKIKRAYAKAVKKYHPEENPQEFQKVYAAYKQAVAFADQGPETQKSIPEDRQEAKTSGSRPEEPFVEKIKPESDTGEMERIRKLFLDMQSRNQKKLDIFRHKWYWYLKNQGDNRAEEEMCAYIRTFWFLDIMDEPSVIAWLAIGFDRDCRDNGRILKEDIRKLYGLEDPGPDNEKIRYQTLFHVLKADKLRLYKEQCEKKLREEEQKRQLERLRQREQEREQARILAEKKNRREIKIICGVLVLLFAVTCIIASLPDEVLNRKMGYSVPTVKREQREILTFLQKNYPMAEFGQPESLKEAEQEGYEEGREYLVKEENCGIDVTVRVLYKDNNMFLWEDFGEQYMRLLAEKSGLVCEMGCTSVLWEDGTGHRLILGYCERPEELLDEMRRFKTFLESGDVSSGFQNIDGVSFCLADCRNPEGFLTGTGKMPKPLLYDMENLPEAEIMAEDMKNSIIEYYIHIEPWEVENDSQYREWLEWYDKQAAKAAKEPASREGAAVAKLAGELGIHVIVFQDGDAECITLGDMYRMAKSGGLSVTVAENGGGFTLEENGRIDIYDFVNGGISIKCSHVLEKFAGGEINGGDRN